MAACGSLQHIFEKPLPENPSLLESLSSWKQITSRKPIEDSSFTEIFGELHFKENPKSPTSSSTSTSSPLPLSSFSSSSTSSFLSIYEFPNTNEEKNKNPISKDYIPNSNSRKYENSHKSSDSFSSMNSESLQLCTEGLGFESSDDVVEDLKSDIADKDWRTQEEKPNNTKHLQNENLCGETRRSRLTSNGGKFPPPISCIGMCGKPWVCFKSYRQDGRFVLREVRIPTQEFLHAYREDGRLKLQFVQSDDEILEQDEEEDEDEDEEEEEEEEEEEDEGNGEIYGDEKHDYDRDKND